MAKLILIRHGESEWNEKGLWTGFANVALDEEGVIQAKEAAQTLTDINFDRAYCSELKRAIETLAIIIDVLGYTVPTFYTASLNERNYGDYTGRNKWDIEKEVGEEQFEKIRRGWDVYVPNGETLKDVSERVVTYYNDSILPYLKEGENVLVSFHGNSMRALIKHIEGISDKDVEKLEVATGEVYVYQLDNTTGAIVSKEIRAAHKNTV